MANTRDIRRRIKSIKNTAQITKAMQMVAASKMRRAQQVALAGRPYAEQMNLILNSVHHAAHEGITHPFLEERENNNPGVLLISTDKGLCGGLNTNLFREVTKLPESTQFVTIGRKGKQFLARTNRNLVADFEIRENATAFQVKQVSQFMIDLFLEKKIDSISVLLPHYVNTLSQEPILVPILPIQEVAKLHVPLSKNQPAAVDHPRTNPSEYLFEPHPKELLGKLLPYYVHFLIFQLLLDARASEHSARMVAMKNATDNAKQIVKDLTLEYNKVRQAAITNEILEIATAQMALS